MDDLFRSTIFYSAALIIIVGACALIHPLPTFVYRTRFRTLLAIIVCGLAIAILWTTTPAAATVASTARAIDRFAPSYHFREAHETGIDATPERVYAAVKGVTPDEIALFQAFTWIRRFGQPAPPSILNPPGRRSILDTALQTGFILLADQPNREIVFGALTIRPPGLATPTADGFRQLDDAGIAKATMNFLIEPSGSAGSRLVTETRVFATDASALRTFTPYWLAIYPGSAILRVTWLRAIKQRAEAPDAF